MQCMPRRAPISFLKKLRLQANSLQATCKRRHNVPGVELVLGPQRGTVAFPHHFVQALELEVCSAGIRVSAYPVPAWRSARNVDENHSWQDKCTILNCEVLNAAQTLDAQVLGAHQITKNVSCVVL
eukprot:365711-Chlamydomonas_euryale.AAC.20